LKAILYFEDQDSVETPAFTINIIYEATEKEETAENSKE